MDFFQKSHMGTAKKTSNKFRTDQDKQNKSKGSNMYNITAKQYRILMDFKMKVVFSFWRSQPIWLVQTVFVTLCDNCTISLSFALKGGVLMQIYVLRCHKKFRLMDQLSVNILFLVFYLSVIRSYGRKHLRINLRQYFTETDIHEA